MIPILPISVPVPIVPFYSQFADISSHDWQKKSCGIASLAMIIDYYKPEKISADALLIQGIASGAYNPDAGWIHKGLINLAKKYDLDGKTYDYSGSTNTKALTKLKSILVNGPVIASVHYKFDPKSTIPHLVVIDGIDGNLVYYNDPTSKVGGKSISVADFQKAWKKKMIVIRPNSAVGSST